MKTFLNRPAEHLTKYELTLDAIAKETVDGNPDLEYLREAGAAFRNLQGACSLRVRSSPLPSGVYVWIRVLMRCV